MSKAAYWQRGETLDYKNNTDTKIEANTVISFGSYIEPPVYLHGVRTDYRAV